MKAINEKIKKIDKIISPNSIDIPGITPNAPINMTIKPKTKNMIAAFNMFIPSLNSVISTPRAKTRQVDNDHMTIGQYDPNENLKLFRRLLSHYEQCHR